MKNCFTLLFLCFGIYCTAQQREFKINWNGFTTYETAYNKIELPSFDAEHFNYSQEFGITFYAQWDASALVDEASVSITNVDYQIIPRTELKDLKTHQLPSELKYSLKNVSARNRKSMYLELSPIISDKGIIKKVTAFTVNYTSGITARSQNQNFRVVTNSVLNSGDWYRFYVESTGVYRLTKDFLSQLGINTNSVDPRTIKIFGNGGQMIPLANSADYPIDVTENAIRFIGEADGSLDSNDYILFYAEGPNGKFQNDYNFQFNTNINLYADKTYYYVNVSPGNGKRIQTINQPSGVADFQVETFEDYQFYEVDENNLARIGRRWFGADFDLENQQTFSFSFPNLIVSTPAKVEISVGAIAPIPSMTTMGISINGNQVSTLNLPSVNLDGSSSLLASSATFNDSVVLTSDDISVTLDYNNDGNPVANAYLDYINIEATRSLAYNNEQLVFTNNSVEVSSGIVEYILSNASGVVEVWDITNKFEVGAYLNTDQQNLFSFKALAGDKRKYLAFSASDALLPQRDNQTSVVNQNLKGTIFQNAQGQFQDVDYLIVTPRNLRSQAERLANINRAQYNLNVKVVDLESIYAEFSTGNQDIAAIRNFVRYIYQNASTPDTRIKYLCLFGDGSYDYKDRIRNNTNIVPPWYSESSFTLTGSFVSDDFYGMMDSNEGLLNISDRLDIAIGRILVENPQRAKDMVDKIASYYQKESFGSWRNNVLLISDDVDEPFERELQEITDGLGETLKVEKPFFNVTKIHLDAFQQQSSSAGDRYPQVASEIKDALEIGAVVVNYFGHGGEDGLAKERIFDKTDAQEINNLCKFNCFVTVTCEYSKFDDPNRITAGEFTFWNKNGGAISLITTTRQIFVNVGANYNETLEDYLFAFGSNDYPSVAEALRLTKIDNAISGSQQKRLVYFIGDPAMKLAFPQPDIRLTHINDVPIEQQTEILEALSYTKLSGEIVDANGSLLQNYNGVLTATVYDKEINRQTLGNDGVTDGNGDLIILDFTTLGEIIFKGQATIENGKFEFDFVVPRDIGIPVGKGKVSFYAQTDNPLSDKSGANFDVDIGGINENAEEDNIGPVINLFMNDENFISGGVTNESPTLLAKLQDANGINTASGIGHDISAILDGDETNPIILNDYYQADIDDYQNGTVSYALRDLEPGLHTLTLKAWDVYNNSSESEIQFIVFDQDEDLVITNVLNYPNPFVNYTEFWFNHNSSDVLDISVQIFTVSGKLVRTLNGQTTGGKSTSSLSKDIIWDGRDDFGEKIGKGVYVYKLKVKSNRLNKQVEKIQKLVIL